MNLQPLFLIIENCISDVTIWKLYIRYIHQITGQNIGIQLRFHTFLFQYIFDTGYNDSVDHIDILRSNLVILYL